MKPEDLPDLTAKELRDLAAAKGVAKAARLTKSELISALKSLLKTASRVAKTKAKEKTTAKAAKETKAAKTTGKGQDTEKSKVKPTAKPAEKPAVKRAQKKASFTAPRNRRTEVAKPAEKPAAKRTQKKASFTAPRSRRTEASKLAAKREQKKTSFTAPRSRRTATAVISRAPKPSIAQAFVFTNTVARSAPPLASPGASAQESNPGLPIPDHYGRDRLVLMVQDPHHLFAYWELTPTTLARIRSAAGGAGTPVLIINAGGKTEFREVDLRGGNYYLAVAPAHSYTAELALRDALGRLHVLARSNTVATPAPGVSTRVDEQWMGVDETFHELLELAGLPGGASRGAGSVARLANQRLAAWSLPTGGVSALSSTTLSSTSLSSTALSSGARLKPAKPLKA